MNLNKNIILSIFKKLTIFIISAVSVCIFEAQAMPSYDDVLLVVNDQSEESKTIGEYFKNARKLPDVNVCHISIKDLQTTSGSEVTPTSLSEKKLAVAAIKNYLNTNNLTDKINYIVLTRGIPYYSYSEWKDGIQLFDLYLLFELSEAAANSSIPDIFSCNKYYYYTTDNYNNRKDYKFTKKKYGYYIIARLDGPGIVNVKKLIDNTGAIAYDSYKKNNGIIKYLTMTPFFPADQTAEISARTNLKIVAPDLKNGEIMSDVGQDVMFAFLNRVDFAIPAVSSISTTIFAPYYASLYYSDSDTVSYHPNIYTGLSFLPGSQITCFRSNPAQHLHRRYGGLMKIDTATKTIADFQKYDGSDLKFRHLTNLIYVPENNTVWCGTGDKQIDIVKGYGDVNVSKETHLKYDSSRGGGIAVFDATSGDVLNWYHTSNSPLKNNRVTKMVFDASSKWIWVSHYGGIQYYDLVNKTWHDISGLQSGFAASAEICLDPHDSDKVYFSFYYTTGYSAINASQIPGAASSIFGYSKSSGSVTEHVINAGIKGIHPFMAKASADYIWVSKGPMLYKYSLKSKSVSETIDLRKVIPEMVTPPEGYNTSVKPALDASGCRALLTDFNKNIIAGIGCLITYTNDQTAVAGTKYQKKNYLVKITENNESPSTYEIINSADMNYISASSLGTNSVCIYSVVADSNSDSLYMALAASNTFAHSTPKLIVKSSDGGKNWSLFSNAAQLANLKNITLANNGALYAVRGYSYGQEVLSDFVAFGACAFGGGMTHSTMAYNPANYDDVSKANNPHPAKLLNYYPSVSVAKPYYSDLYSWYGSPGGTQQTAMTFMILDGFYTAEARFGVFQRYPCTGSAGYEGHMLVFEPKCAPFAPRVDEENLSTFIINNNTIEIPLKSPGLPLAMDGFIPETINSGTVTVKDELGKPVAAMIEYAASGNKIVLTGDFSGLFYQVTLKCGVDGIKNTKGASLTNTRADEFKDEITYTFGISTEIYTPPADVTGPVKMPATNSKCDLIVSRVWWSGKPVIGQPLTVNFDISNLGTAKTNAGAGVQKAKVYLNNVLADVKTFNDIAPKGKVSLTATIPGASIVGGKQNKVMVWADATNKVTEIRETNNTNSASFMLETRPDLIVKEITLSPKPVAKKPLTIYYKISNIGASATTAGVGVQVATVFVDGKSAGAVAYDDVPKGGSITKQLVLPSGITTAGIHKIKVSADTNKEVDESNELNNYLEKSFLIAK